MLQDILENLNPDILFFRAPGFLLDKEDFKTTLNYAKKFDKQVIFDNWNYPEYEQALDSLIKKIGFACTYLSENSPYDYFDSYSNISNTINKESVKILLGGAHILAEEESNGKLKATSCIPYTAKMISDYVNKSKEIFVLESLTLGNLEKDALYKVEEVNKESILDYYAKPYALCSKITQTIPARAEILALTGAN